MRSLFATNSFTTRVTLQFAALVTATTAVVLLVGGWLQSRQAVAGLDFLNAAEYQEIRQRLGVEPRGLSPASVEALVREHVQIDAAQYFFQVRSRTGQLLFRSPNLGETVLPGGPQTDGDRTVQVPGLGRMRLSEFGTGDLHVLVASSLEPAERLLRDYAQTSVVLLFGVGLASLGLGWYFARLTLRPVKAIRETASRIGPDTLGERIPIPEGQDELSALARLLNDMFDRLEASFTQVRRFTADASHELKTPLALLRLNAEKLQRRVATDPEAAEAVGQMLEDLDALRRMIESLLCLAKAESGTLAPALAEVEVGEFVRSFGEDAAAIAEDRGVIFNIEKADTGMVRCEKTLMRQVLFNLLDNARRATPPGGRIALDSTLGGGRWRLALEDEGPGVSDAQLTRIFERFVRFGAGEETGANGSGHGLGLAICRSIVALHGGVIEARNRSDRSGLRVTIELPAKS